MWCHYRPAIHYPLPFCETVTQGICIVGLTSLQIQTAALTDHVKLKEVINMNQLENKTTKTSEPTGSMDNSKIAHPTNLND